ncbi:MAG: TolC family protein [Fibrobacterota bacterium]
MKTTAIILLNICLVCIYITRVEAENYTLDQLVTFGYKNSPELKQIRKEVEKVGAQIDEAYGRAMPRVSVSANFQYAFESFNALSAGMSGNSLSLTDIAGDAYRSNVINEQDMAVMGIVDQALGGLSSMEAPPNAVNLGLTLQQPLFAQGKVSTGLKIAKTAQRSLVCKMQDAEQRTRAEVTRLFYGAMLARENIALQDESVRIARESHRLSVVRHALGTGSELDTLSSQIRVQQVQIESENAQSDYLLALEALIQGTGIKDTPDSVQLTGDFPDDEFDISLDEALSRMENENKQLGQLLSGEQIHGHLLTMSKTDFLPKVYAGASLGRIALFDWGDPVTWHDDQKVFIGMEMDLFTGVQRLYKVRQARADLERVRINRQDVISDLRLAVKSAHKKMRLARRQVKQTEAMISLAEKGHQIAKRAYEIGKNTLVELQNSELQLKQARMAHNAARMNFYMAVVDLRLLMGDFNI